MGQSGVQYGLRTIDRVLIVNDLVVAPLSSIYNSFRICDSPHKSPVPEGEGLKEIPNAGSQFRLCGGLCGGVSEASEQSQS